jgi:amphi-Trp domain-containing protein
MDLVKLKEKDTVSRDIAAARLRAIADQLACENGITVVRDRLRFDISVPERVGLSTDFEASENSTGFEIGITW